MLNTLDAFVNLAVPSFLLLVYTGVNITFDVRGFIPRNDSFAKADELSLIMNEIKVPKGLGGHGAVGAAAALLDAAAAYIILLQLA